MAEIRSCTVGKYSHRKNIVIFFLIQQVSIYFKRQRQLSKYYVCHSGGKLVVNNLTS